jgi:hypothetical protein
VIVVEYKQLTEGIPIFNRVFSGDGAEEQFDSLFERAKDGLY